MRRLELLIAQARSETQNREYSATIGIPQDDFESWANEAQDRGFSEIVKVQPRLFHATKIYSLTAGEESYDLPADCYEGKVTLVEYSPDGNVENYYPLDKLTNRERITGSAGDPSFYMIQGDTFILMSRPSSNAGAIRMTYVRKPKRLGIRRGVIASRTLSTLNLTALTLSSVTTLDTSLKLADNNYLSVVNRDGNQTMAGIEYDSINTGTGVVTITGSSFTAQTGETAAVGAYVVIGKNAANISTLPESCDRYLIKWLAACALERDGSALEQRKRELAAEMIDDITSSFADSDHDVVSIPIINIENLGAWDEA